MEARQGAVEGRSCRHDLVVLPLNLQGKAGSGRTADVSPADEGFVAVVVVRRLQPVEVLAPIHSRALRWLLLLLILLLQPSSLVQSYLAQPAKASSNY